MRLLVSFDHWIRDRPATHRLPIWRGPWHGWRIISSQPPMGMFSSKPGLSADPRLRGNSRETSSASRRISDCNFLVWVFSPPRLVARLAPGGWGFPLALEVIRNGLPSTTLRIRAAGFDVCYFGSRRFALKRVATRRVKY